jgi:hypothetical protein
MRFNQMQASLLPLLPRKPQHQFISPEVLRELRRHVSAKPLPKSTTGAGSAAAAELQGQHSKSLSRILGACVVLTATAATFPLVAYWWISEKGGLSEKEGALTAP